MPDSLEVTASNSVSWTAKKNLDDVDLLPIESSDTLPHDYTVSEGSVYTAEITIAASGSYELDTGSGGNITDVLNDTGLNFTSWTYFALDHDADSESASVHLDSDMFFIQGGDTELDLIPGAKFSWNGNQLKDEGHSGDFTIANNDESNEAVVRLTIIGTVEVD